MNILLNNGIEINIDENEKVNIIVPDTAVNNLDIHHYVTNECDDTLFCFEEMEDCCEECNECCCKEELTKEDEIENIEPCCSPEECKECTFNQVCLSLGIRSGEDKEVQSKEFNHFISLIDGYLAKYNK